MTSRLLGLVREQVLAAIFGAGNAMDAFLVAFRIPNLVRDLFAEGALSAAFVPTFTRHLTQHGKASAWRLANLVITALLLITGLLVVLGIVFARPLVTAFAADFALEPGKLELTVALTRVMLPFLPLVAVAAATMGMLNSLHRFFIPALSPAMFNVAIIVCAVALVPLMPALGQPAIMAIAIGAVVGGVAQVALQWPSLGREGYRFRPALDFSDQGLRRVLVLMGPGTIGLAATQVNLFVNTVLATGEAPGTVSWLGYAFRIMYLPIGIFGVSIATATLPAVSRHAAAAGGEDRPAIRRTMANSLSLMATLNLPATVGLVVLAVPVVQVIFERGAFLPADTLATAAALQFYALGLIGYSVVRITSPAFYALGQPLTPIKVSVASMLANVVLNLVLIRLPGEGGRVLLAGEPAPRPGPDAAGAGGAPEGQSLRHGLRPAGEAAVTGGSILRAGGAARASTGALPDGGEAGARSTGPLHGGAAARVPAPLWRRGTLRARGPAAVASGSTKGRGDVGGAPGGRGEAAAGGQAAAADRESEQAGRGAPAADDLRRSVGWVSTSLDVNLNDRASLRR
jgi:putative peptidoglycan lipid II flippase